MPDWSSFLIGFVAGLVAALGVVALAFVNSLERGPRD